MNHNSTEIPEAQLLLQGNQLPLMSWESPQGSDETVLEIRYDKPGSYNTVTADESVDAEGRLKGLFVFWRDFDGIWHPAHMVGQQDCGKLPRQKNFYFRQITTDALRVQLMGSQLCLERLTALESRQQDVPKETDLLELEPNIAPNPGQVRMIRAGYTMFLHFGLNTFTDREWSFGELSPAVYAPSQIDADQWVRTAWEAGMNSVILVTKHHDGFSLWDSRYTDYSVGNPASGSHIDVLQKVSDACNHYGIRMGVYYSAWDNNWDRRHGKENDAAYCQFMRSQLGEIMSGRYGLKDENGRGQISELWIDGTWEKSADRWEFDKLYDHVKKLQPDCQIGLNWTIGEDIHRYIWVPNQKEGDPIHYWCSDFRLGDGAESREDDPKLFRYRGQIYYLPFEATLCMSSSHTWKPSWFWHPGYGEEGTKAPEEIAEKYRKYQKEHNVLVLNCAPNREGRLEQPDIDALHEAARILGIARGSAR